MKNDKTVLLAGATGYLGSHIAKELAVRKVPTKIVVRKTNKAKHLYTATASIIKAEVTQPETLKGLCNGVDIVISTVGITRQKEGLTYWDVDYQSNLNLLREAISAGVQKFIYVSVLKGNQHRNLKICEAKESFVDRLVDSGIAYTIMRPNGFFSDMKDFLKMAKKGKVYLFGNGKQKFNPIHGHDLAIACVDAIETATTEINIGGPDILTYNEVANFALLAHGKPINIIHLPHWIRKFIIWILRTFTSVKTYGPIEFFLTLMAEDAIAPRYGSHRLASFFHEEVDPIK
ncbi:SDR family oxidoreductase [Aurantibacter crassamenti]|uniref:SDR family oxidoreductase n=1 Tax=Aurantibacter crassamenti TaxID=1837375 RepID=UPI0019397E08|nr:SDR family oxidoreductase [Aurantibacter crassamenti]MBM1106554.1 SDR family oxidoreductase [Aurantibacter crassamenti]